MIHLSTYSLCGKEILVQLLTSIHNYRTSVIIESITWKKSKV